jgi:hypothetical protein
MLYIVLALAVLGLGLVIWRAARLDPLAEASDDHEPRHGSAAH